MIHICAPLAPIRCHALTTLRASRRRMAQHDSVRYFILNGLASRSARMPRLIIIFFFFELFCSVLEALKGARHSHQCEWIFSYWGVRSAAAANAYWLLTKRCCGHVIVLPLLWENELSTQEACLHSHLALTTMLFVVSVFGSGGKKVLVQFWFKYVFTT